TMVVLIVVLVIVVGGIIIALFGWDRYRGASRGAGPSAGAKPTSEVFIEPDTGRRMRVWYDASTGQREYRPDDT
ncbi:MAG: hypothetical protein ACREN4_09615, partial [Candidatus Dormibacteria bacterium]